MGPGVLQACAVCWLTMKELLTYTTQAVEPVVRPAHNIPDATQVMKLCDLARASRYTTLRVLKADTGEYVCEAAAVANTFLSRLVGLLGKQSLQNNAGLWIYPSSGVHTLGMKFIIDVIAVDKGMRIVELCSNLQPNRVAGLNRSCCSVLELPAGAIKRTQVALGDLLVVEEVA